MTKAEIAAIVLAAGMGTRMESDRPKVLHALAGRPMIGHVMGTLAALEATRVVVVAGARMEGVAEAVAGAAVAIQDPPFGTGHAVLAAREALSGFAGDVLIVYGDTPLMRPATLQAMLAARHEPQAPSVVVLGFRPDDPAGYGRLVVGADGLLERIVEHRDATAEEQAVALCNGGAMAVDGALLFDLLDAVGNDNSKGEYYLTDIVAIARDRDLACAVVEGEAEDVLGINTRAQLAEAESVIQERLRRAAMDKGATLVDPETVYLSHDTVLGRDSTVGPHVVFGPGVRVGSGVTIKAFSHLEGAHVADGASIGPFARLRPGAEIGPEVHVGNFVEIKQATLEAGAKVNHLTYIGDARVGAGANVGAGTITCNYDGFTKSFTDIGARAFIGSNTALVAPVKVGDGAVIGAGSVIARDVPADALALTRAEHTEIEDGASRLRARGGGGDKKAGRAQGPRKKASGG